MGTRKFYDPSRGKKLEGKASMSYKAESSTFQSKQDQPFQIEWSISDLD